MQLTHRATFLLNPDHLQVLPLMGHDHMDFILAHLCTCRCNLKLPQNLSQTKRLISFVPKNSSYPIPLLQEMRTQYI